MLSPILIRDRVEDALRRRVTPLIVAQERRRQLARRHPRAVQAFAVYCASATTEVAAHQLGVTPRTVRWHVETVMAALDASSARQAAYLLWGPAQEART
jgi:hypothetical protein